MTNNAQPSVSTPSSAMTGMRGEIGQKWNKFSAAEIVALKDKGDLVSQVQSKYSLDKAQAQKDVDAFANGRQL